MACGIEPRISFRTRSFELIRGLIGHKQGYSIHNAVPRTTIGYDGSRVAVVPITEKLPPTHVMALRLKRHALRPAVQTFADYAREAFSVGGQFAPGSIAPSRIDAA
jgi:DNA-binding transcriptional LysR family regulator